MQQQEEIKSKYNITLLESADRNDAIDLITRSFSGTNKMIQGLKIEYDDLNIRNVYWVDKILSSKVRLSLVVKDQRNKMVAVTLGLTLEEYAIAQEDEKKLPFKNKKFKRVLDLKHNIEQNAFENPMLGTGTVAWFLIVAVDPELQN